MLSLDDAYEARRIAVLRAYRIVDTPQDARYDRISKLAAALLRAPFAAIGFLDERRIWFKSQHGFSAAAAPRPAFCDSIIACNNRPLAVSDATQHANSARHPFVTGSPFVKGVVAVPLIASGHTIGIIAVFDDRPRPDFTDGAAEALAPLAEQVLELLELESARRAVLLRDEEVRRLEKRVARLAAVDPAPAALPCSLFLDRLAKTLDARMPQNGGVLLFLDAEGFSRVNAAFGRAAGDDALREIAARIKESIGAFDTFTRRDADHFAVLTNDFDEMRMAKLRERIEAPLSAGCAGGLRLSFRIGAVRLRDIPPGERPDRVLQLAERAAQESVGPAVFATAEHRTAVLADDTLAMQLIEAVERGTIELHYQPLVAAADRALLGFEALARWSLPGGQAMQPARFMVMADRYGQAFPLGEQLLRKACSTCCEYVGVDPSFALHVNVSPVQLAHPLFEVSVNDALRLSGMPPRNLCLEITEAAIADPEIIGPKIARMRKTGVRFALDDFGMGYSSLSHIRRLPVDAIKIDRYFVSGSPGDSIADPPIVRTVTTLAKELGLLVVAEGVETPAQERFLRELGCDVLQGYLFGRPAPYDTARLSSPARV